MLDEGNAHYVGHVLRLDVGDKVETFDGVGGIDRWEVAEKKNRNNELRHVSHEEMARRSPVHLVLGLNPLKGGNEETAIRMAAAMEVAELVMVFFNRSDIPFDASKLGKRLDRWKRLCVAEVSVSGGAYLPRIRQPVEFEAFMENPVKGVLFDEEAEAGAGQIDFKRGDKVAALVGPEGGLERGEVELAREKGFVIASLGEWVLRAELAGTFAPHWVYTRVNSGESDG